MPEPLQPEEISQKIIFDYRENIGDPQLVGYLKQVDKSLKAAKKSLSAYQKQFKSFNMSSKKQSATQAQVAATWNQIASAYKAGADSLKDHAKTLVLTRRETGKLQSQTDGLLRSFKSMAGLLGIGGLGVAAYKKIQDMISSRFDLAISGGPRLFSMVKGMVPPGIPPTAAFNLVSQHLGQSLFSRFGANDEKSIAGLLNLQKALAPVGLERSAALIQNVLKDLEPQRLKEVLRLASLDPKIALQRAATGTTIGAASDALNALSVSQTTAEQDPMLQGAKQMTAGIEKLNTSIEKLLADGFQKLLPQIEMLAKAISGVADNSGTAAAIGAGAIGAYGVSKILPKVALPAIGTGTAVGTTRLLPSSGIGLAKTLGSVGAFIYGMLSVADSLDATLNNKRVSEWNLAGRLGQSFGPAKEIIEYQEMIDRNKAYLDARMAKVVKNPATIAGFNPLKPFKAFGDIIDKARDRVLDFVRALGDRNVKRIQDMLGRRQELELNADVAGSETELARLRLQYMMTQPLGIVSSLPELQSLNAMIRDEMSKLQAVLGSIDQSEQKGIIAANQIRASILKLGIEERQNMQMLNRALLDSVIAESFGAGLYEKVLITQDRNLAQGLEKGIIGVNIDRAFVGSLTPSGQQPVRPQDVMKQMREQMPVKAISLTGGSQNVIDQLDEITDSHLNLAKQNQKLKQMLDNHLDTDDGVQSYRQTRIGGRTALGGPGT